MVSQERWGIPSPAGVTCPAPMTRAALLALRASAGLSKDCDYVVTDHVQGRLVAGTTIHMQAVDASTLAMRVEVKTTYDNVAWAGVYDIDRALVLELTDNRGNTAKGFNGSEVSNFDWGNLAYTGCRVENATWAVTYGNAAQMLRVAVWNSATLNTSGFTGSMQDNSIHTAASVNFTGANGSWRYQEWWGGGSFNATGYTGGGDNYYNEWNISTVNFSGLTGNLVLRNNETVNSSITAAGAQSFQIQNANLISMVINRSATGGSFSADQLSCREGGNINHTGAGALNSTGAQVNGTISLTGAGPITFNYCRSEQSTSVSNAGSGSLSMTRTTLDGAASNVTLDAGSSKAVTVNDCNLYSFGMIQVVGAVGGSPFNVTTSKISSNSYIYVRHTGALSVSQSELSGSSGIDVQSGDRSYNVIRADMRAVSRATFTGTGAVTDSINDLDIAARGILAISCSGTANTLNCCTIAGLSGQISLTGTTGAQIVGRLKCYDGWINIVNCTVNTGAQLCTAADVGVITLNGITAAKTVQYLTARAGGVITINNSTGGGVITNVEATTGGSYVCSGPAGNASGVLVQRGVLSHNGGALASVLKAGTATLKTGNFSHTNIAAFLNTNVTLTAANTNRQTLYTGGALI
jgi:hypothetical protein